jgi:hypothetical protein
MMRLRSQTASVGRMPTFADLDRLPTRELHDRAVRRAKRHLDARFFWTLLEITPAADVAEGDFEAAETDVEHWSAQVADALHRDADGSLDARRAYYLEYLVRHGG